MADFTASAHDHDRACLVPPQAAPVTEFPRQFARTRRFSLGVPRQFTISPDGRRVVFLRTGAADPVSMLWLYEDGNERILLDAARTASTEVPAAERTRRERARESAVGVVRYATDAAVRTIACALDGALWVVRPDDDAAFRVPTAGPVVDPRPSPDGRWIAYVTGGALHVVSLDGRDEPLAAPEGPDVTFGLSDHVAAESMGRDRGYWWSPDSSAVLAARVDSSRVQRRYISDPANPEAPPRPVRYPAAGTANADVSLHILNLDGDRIEVRWDRTAFEYLPSARWDEHGPLIAVQTRDQRTVRTLAVDPASGSTSMLHEQRDRAWVELVPGTPRRTGAGRLIVTRDEEDTRRLVVDGSAVTPAGLHVREVLGPDGESVLFTASDDPTRTHVWSWTPEHGCVQVSDEPGLHTAVAAGGTMVLTSHVADRREFTVRTRGTPQGRIGCVAEQPVVTPRPVFLRLGERALCSSLYLPSWHQRARSPLPVLVDPYGGQGLQLATRGLGWWSCLSQWFAEQGFAVLVTDGRGSPGRGPAWEKAIRGDILSYALEDQVEALHAAAEHQPDLDLERVAIRGWSFGGYLAAGAVLRRPDVFHTAVAGAPPTDHRLYDTHWKERYLGHPDEEPENYDRCSLIADAARLRRPLLLIHGLADDNVAVAHTLRLSAALLSAGRPHQVLPLPGTSHLVTQEDVAENLLRFQLDFIRQSLNLS